MANLLGPQLKVYATCIGVKKRCRNADRHMLKIGNFPLGADREMLKGLARSTIIKEMRTVQAAAMLHVDFVEVKDEGFLCETWMPFDERHERYPLEVANG